MNLIANMLARCTVVFSKAALGMQRLQIRLTANETKDNVELFEQYGFTSIPKEGATGVALFFGGDRSHGIVLAAGDKRYRLTDLEEGEVAIYTDEGSKIVMKRGRIIDVDCDVFNLTTKQFNVTATESVDMNAPKTNVTGFETLNFNAGALAMESDSAKSSAVLEAPDVKVSDISLIGHVHNETGSVTEVMRGK